MESFHVTGREMKDKRGQATCSRSVDEAGFEIPFHSQRSQPWFSKNDIIS